MVGRESGRAEGKGRVLAGKLARLARPRKAWRRGSWARESRLLQGGAGALRRVKNIRVRLKQWGCAFAEGGGGACAQARRAHAQCWNVAHWARCWRAKRLGGRGSERWRTGRMGSAGTLGARRMGPGPPCRVVAARLGADS